ncbi:ATP-binding protein [Marivirga sp.]|uniref:ATP-binding protein n=1 Tax=Marivirga sp. TaxID=2018662 RepID=UPI003DA766DE
MKKFISNIAFIKLLVWIVIYIFFLPTVYSQEKLEDSAQYYVSVAKENWHNDIQKSHQAAKNAYQLIASVNNQSLKADVYAQYGISFYTNQKYDSAIKYYRKAIQSVEKEDPNKYRFISYLCSAYEKKGHYKDVFDIIADELISNPKNNPEYFNLLLVKLSAALKIGLTEESLITLKQVEDLIPNLDTLKNYSKYISLKGKYYQNIASYRKSDSIFSSLIHHYDTINNKMDKAETFLFLAQNAMEVSRYKESSQYLIKAQSIYDSLNYQYGKANIDLSKGTLLSWMQRYNEASTYIFKALETFEENKNVNEMQIAYYELGWIFYSLELENRAKNYLFKAIQTARNIQNIKYLGREYNALGSLYTDLKKYDSAILYFDSAIHFQKITKNTKGLSAAKFNKAVVLEKIGKDEEALKIYKESYKVDLELNNYAGLIEGEWVLGEYYMKYQKLDSAKYYFDLGEKHAIDLGEKYFLLKIYQAQANLYSKKENHKLSSEYLQKALIIQKELAEENKTLELATLETTYDLKNKEKELALLNLQKENNEQTIALNQKTIASQRNTLIVLIVGIVILLILSYIIFRYLKIRTKTNHQLRDLNFEIQEKQEEIMAQSEELKEANDHVNELNEFLEKKVKERTIALENALSELDHFFYRASHDFRGPLTTLMGLVGISKGYDLPNEANELFSKVNITVKKLDGMVKKLQAVSFLGDFENLKSPQKIEIEGEIIRIVDEVVKNKFFDGIDNNYDININTSVKEMIFYPVILNICLSNLIENSLIFNHSKTKVININVESFEDQLILSVKDNGTGISNEQQAEIFDMFKRTSPTSTGNGLGLYIVKKAIEILDGKIKLESDTRIGSTFTLIFPLEGIKHNFSNNYDKVFISS